MQDRYSADSYPASRPVWRTRFEAYVLAGAIIGLAGCLVKMGWLCFTM